MFRTIVKQNQKVVKKFYSTKQRALPTLYSMNDAKEHISNNRSLLEVDIGNKLESKIYLKKALLAFYSGKFTNVQSTFVAKYGIDHIYMIPVLVGQSVIPQTYIVTHWHDTEGKLEPVDYDHSTKELQFYAGSKYNPKIVHSACQIEKLKIINMEYMNDLSLEIDTFTINPSDAKIKLEQILRQLEKDRVSSKIKSDKGAVHVQIDDNTFHLSSQIDLLEYYVPVYIYYPFGTSNEKHVKIFNANCGTLSNNRILCPHKTGFLTGSVFAALAGVLMLFTDFVSFPFPIILSTGFVTGLASFFYLKRKYSKN